MVHLYWQVPKKVNSFFSLLADAAQNKTRNISDMSPGSYQAPVTASVRPMRPGGETPRNEQRDRPEPIGLRGGGPGARASGSPRLGQPQPTHL